MFFDFLFAQLHEIRFALMVLGQTVILTVRAITFVTLKTEKTDFLAADETFRVIGLFGRDWWLWILHRFDFFLDLLVAEMLSELEGTYL